MGESEPRATSIIGKIPLASFQNLHLCRTPFSEGEQMVTDELGISCSIGSHQEKEKTALACTTHELRNEMVRAAEMGLSWGLKKHCSR
jgi:hypothetical protein